MTATLDDPVRTAPADRPIPFGRLLRAEARKSVDTVRGVASWW